MFENFALIFKENEQLVIEPGVSLKSFFPGRFAHVNFYGWGTGLFQVDTENQDTQLL